MYFFLFLCYSLYFSFLSFLLHFSPSNFIPLPPTSCVSVSLCIGQWQQGNGVASNLPKCIGSGKAGRQTKRVEVEWDPQSLPLEDRHLHDKSVRVGADAHQLLVYSTMSRAVRWPRTEQSLTDSQICHMPTHSFPHFLQPWSTKFFALSISPANNKQVLSSQHHNKNPLSHGVLQQSCHYDSPPTPSATPFALFWPAGRGFPKTTHYNLASK